MRSHFARRIVVGLLLFLAVGGPAGYYLLQPDTSRSSIQQLFPLLAYEIALVVITLIVLVAKELGKRWSSEMAQAIDYSIRRQLSPFTARYLSHVFSANRYLEAKGLLTRGEYTLQIADVAVEVPLAVGASYASVRTPSVAGLEPSEHSSLWLWLQQASAEGGALVVIGPAGSGKTTMMRQAAASLARYDRHSRRQGAPRRIPILVSLRDFRDFGFHPKQTILDLLDRAVSEVPYEAPTGWLRSNFVNGRLLVIVDGLDEEPRPEARAQIVSWLDKQALSATGNMLIVTSRPFGYLQNPLSAALTVRLQPLRSRQIEQFLRNWYRATMVRSYGADNRDAQRESAVEARELTRLVFLSPQLRQLASNPLLLTMIANVHHYRGALPGSRGELYSEICDVLLSRRQLAKGLEGTLNGPKQLVVIRELAYRMMEDERVELASSDAVKILLQPLARVGAELTPEQFLRTVSDASGLLVEKERGLYSFVHLSFQEYLAATHVAATLRPEALTSRIDSPWWRETIRLYCASADATAIVETCLRRTLDADLLTLAGLCASEAREMDLSARSKLGEALDPIPAWGDPERLRIVAAARLNLRAASARAAGVAGPITVLEYGLFVAGVDEAPLPLPDHWTSVARAASQQGDPVVGLRFSDAAMFCAWLTRDLGDGVTYRLPRADEIPVKPRVGREPHNGDSTDTFTAWTSSFQESPRETGFYRLVRTGQSPHRRDPFPAVPDSELAACVEAMLGEDVGRIVPGQDRRAVLRLVQEAARSTMHCDGEQMLGAAVSAQRALVDGFFRGQTPDSSELAARIVDRLAALCESLEVVLDRNTIPTRRSAAHSALRAKARSDCLSVALMALDLHRRTGGSGLTAFRLGEHRSGEGRFRVDPRTVTSIVGSTLLGLYVDLVLLENRLAGNVAPREAIFIVADMGQRPAEIDEGPQSTPFRSRGYRYAKPAFDRAAAVILLAFAAPTLAATAIVIRLTSPGPAFYRQVRIGQNGQSFNLWKLRTMYVDADARRAKLIGGEDGVLLKIRRDPRVTPVGRFLRRFSIDELPQILNVARGEMSLVGPRPPLAEEYAMYSDRIARKLLVKPGLTGLWQVSGRSDLSWEDSVRLDLRYVENYSVSLDVLILYKTVKAVLSGSGAY